MPLFKRAGDKALTSTPAVPQRALEISSHPCYQVARNSSSTWGATASPTNYPTHRPTASSTFSWDVTIFPETSYLLPNDRNGDWMTEATHLLKSPGTTASNLDSSLSWPHLHSTLTSAADSASDTLTDNINRAFSGHDLPAMHDRVMNLVPSVTLPTLREVSRGVDDLTDRAQDMIQRRRRSETFSEDDLPRDDLWFARHMGAKARRQLVAQGICREWQIMSTRETLEWQSQLENALARVYEAEEGGFGVKEMFGMMPVWMGDVENSEWWLELDTGLVEVVGENDECGEKRVCLRVDFALPERTGRVRVRDVERGVVEMGEWMAVE
jgi:hypothetical protein